jgi:hypothetical protein
VRADSYQDNGGGTQKILKRVKRKYKFQRETEDRGSQNLPCKNSIPEDERKALSV